MTATTAEWRRAHPLMTISEVVFVTGLTPSGVEHAIRRGELRVQIVDGARHAWWTDVEALQARTIERRQRVAARRAAAAASRSPRRTVPAAPLLRAIELQGGLAACGIRKGSLQEAVRLAKLYGRLTPRAAEELAVKVLGLTPWELWDDLLEVKPENR